MARTPEPKQAEPTRPREINPDGHLLDAHGLPIGGPARVRALKGAPDPALTDAPPSVPALAPPVTAPASAPAAKEK